MARLVLLNGPPAAGKSTLARRWAAAHPLTLALDVDGLRDMLGAWRGDPRAAGRAAREIALAAAATHLAAGHDVVVPQLLARPEFPDRLAALAGAGYVEIVLTLSREESVRRYVQRWRAGVDPVHSGGAEPDPAAIGALYDRVLEFTATRPHVALAADGTPDEVLAGLGRCLAAPA